MVLLCLEPPLAALPNPHFTHSAASTQTTNQKMEECDVAGVTGTGSDCYGYQQVQGKQGKQKRKCEQPEALWGHSASGCISAVCSASLSAVEAAGCGR